MFTRFINVTILILILFCFTLPVSSEIDVFRNNLKRTGESQYIGPNEPNLMWTYHSGAFITGTPAVDAEGNLYFGDHNGFFFKLSSSGEPIWSYETSDIIVSSPTLDESGSSYFGCLDNTFYSIDQDGSLKWTFKTGGPIYSSPVIESDTIFFGSDDHNLYALDKSGNLKWSFTTNSWISSSPSVDDDGTIYFVSYDGNLYSLNPDGSLKFSYNTNTYLYSTPAINKNGEIFFGGYDGNLYAIKDGELLWTFQTGSIIYSSPAISSSTDTIYFGSNDNYVYALSSDGNIEWSFGINSAPLALHNFSSSPVIDRDENIYIASQNSFIYSLDSSGDARWSYKAYRPAIVSSPIIAEDKVVYFISTYSGIYALTDISKGGFVHKPNADGYQSGNHVIPPNPDGFYKEMKENGFTSANPNDINDPSIARIFADRLNSCKSLNLPNNRIYNDKFNFQGTSLPYPNALDEAMKIVHLDMMNFKQDLFFLPSLPYILSITEDVMENPFRILDRAHDQVEIIHDPATTIYGIIKDGAELLDQEVEEIYFSRDLPESPLVDAIEKLYEIFGIPLVSSEIEELESLTSALESSTKNAAAFLIYACEEAIKIRDEAMLSLSTNEKNFLNNNMIDPVMYYKDLALQILSYCEKIDRAKLSEAGMILAYAVDNLNSVMVSNSFKETEQSYNQITQNGDVEGDVLFYYPTPVGSIIIGGPGKTIYNSTLDSVTDKTKVPLLIVDLGGNDEYYNRAGATFDIKNGVSLLIDFSGNDTYYSDADFSQGAGKLGVGILYDFEGDDNYTAMNFAQGAAYIGIGAIHDESGDDIYDAAYNVQSAAMVGVGILSDKGGSDEYYARTGCQSYAFCLGASIFKESEGNDFYFAGAGRSAPYDIEPGYNRYTSQAQGAAFGIRNNYVNEPQASGGVAIFSDNYGNDVYIGDFYSQGNAYWLDTAILVDSHGDDIYYARQYTQGAGIHLAVGLLLDESGNDSYITRSVSQGCGHDTAAGLLVDNGGNDIYIAQDLSQGGGNDWALSLLADASGNDQYFAHPTHSNQGYGNFREVMGSVGLLLDVSGNDYYTALYYEDNKHWTKELHGIGIDNECGDTGVH